MPSATASNAYNGLAWVVVDRHFTGETCQAEPESLFRMLSDVPSTGGHYRDEEMHLWTFDAAGRVIRLRHHTDKAKHIRAAGLRERRSPAKADTMSRSVSHLHLARREA